MNRTLILFLLTALVVSGCIEDKEIASTPAVPEISQPELVPGEFEIDIASYYFVYLRDNLVIHEYTTKQTSDLVEKNYIIYHLSIKNNDTNTLNFSINKLLLHARNQVFTPADLGTLHKFPKTWVYVLSEIENENRLNDTLLLPHQTLEGIVIFQVDNYTTLFNRSFSLRYNTTPIPSTSFERSLEALTVAEQFDYSIAFHMPPYDIHGGTYSYYPEPGDYYVWANWVNISVFEYYKKYDEMYWNIPSAEIAYAVKVIPEQDLTVFHSNPFHITSEGKYKGTQLYVVDDTGEEHFNKSINSRNDDTGLAILDNQTYRPFLENMTQMFIPQATIVHFSFYSIHGGGLAMRLTFNNQDIILDEQNNITLARYDFSKIVS